MRPQFSSYARVCVGLLVLARAGAAWAQSENPSAEPTQDSWSTLSEPSPLLAHEEASPACATLARRFNPAMAFGHRDVWPVEVRYAWHDGSDLVAHVVDNSGQILREYVAREHADLANNDWGDLPDRDPDGNRIDYYVDAPGDDRVDHGASGWVRRWRAIMGGDAHSPPAALDYAPTQYAHLFWLNRERGLLAIQYWFYFPYNEWINHHEGDWEHINVILRGPPRLRGDAGYRVVGYQFFFHSFTLEPGEVVRLADGASGGADERAEHVLIYTGGRSHFLAWSGIQSGGSYPLPARYPAAGGGLGAMAAYDDTTRPARFIAADDFKIVLLPEPHRLDVGQRPDLAWLRLAFFAGQAQVFRNPLSLNGMVFGGTPRQPARQESWNNQWLQPYWTGTPQVDRASLALPRNWTRLSDRPPQDRDPVFARRSTRSPARVRRSAD